MLLFILSVFFLAPLTLARGSGQQRAKVLFLTNSERGQSSVHLATAHTLLCDYSDAIDVHFATFDELAPVVAQVSRQASSDADRRITFHPVRGSPYKKSIYDRGAHLETARHGTGVWGAERLFWLIQVGLIPWTGAEYIEIANNIRAIVEEVQPDLAVIDTFYSPAVDAVEAAMGNGSHVMLSPNDLKDLLAAVHPHVGALWKYPVVGSGFPYPLPWYLIPANIYICLRMGYAISSGPAIKEFKSYLRSQNYSIHEPMFHFVHPAVPMLVASSLEIEYPMSVPKQVSPVGPIFMALESAEKEDPDLVAWLARAPTVLIILGSHTTYDEHDATEMIRAIRMVLDRNDQVQVLWKLKIPDDGSKSARKEDVDALLVTGRVRIESWFKADPASLLATGHIVAYVNHGGANSYFEAMGTGVPQVALAMWADCYDHATRVEWLGIGVWGNRQAAPYWTGEEASQAILKVISDSSYAEKAKTLVKPKEQQGRYVAARKIAEWAEANRNRRLDALGADAHGAEQQIPIQMGSKRTASDEL
ncbi:putative udp-glucoronosyl and udp-glucosyl transferase family protein [Lipomyces tetrasporus]